MKRSKKSYEEIKSCKKNKYITIYSEHKDPIIPAWLLRRKEISHGAKSCYACLTGHYGKKRKCYPSRRTIGQEIGGLSERTISRHIKQLEEYGLIEVERKEKKSNKYQFLHHEWEKQVNDKNVPGDRTKVSHYIKNNKNKKNEKDTKQVRTDNESTAEWDITLNARKNSPQGGELALSVAKLEEKEPSSLALNQIVSIFFRLEKKKKLKKLSSSDKKIAQLLYKDCLADRPEDAKGLFKEKARILIRTFKIKSLKTLKEYWDIDHELLLVKKRRK